MCKSRAQPLWFVDACEAIARFLDAQAPAVLDGVTIYDVQLGLTREDGGGEEHAGDEGACKRRTLHAPTTAQPC